MSFALDYPWVLAAAAGFGLVVVGLVWLEFVRRRKRLRQLGTEMTLARILPDAASVSRIGRRPIWLGSAAVLAGIALAGPRWGTPMGFAETEGIDVVYAIDASMSMLAPDVNPNRLERAKHEARRLRALSRGDRVGLIAFAGRSYILTPLTADDGALALFLDNLDPSIVGQPGSSLASAIRQGVDLLGPAAGSDRAVVIFSDGEAFDEGQSILVEAQRAKEKGVSIVTVGFGTEEGSQIPVQVGYEQYAPKRDTDGRIVITKYNPTVMQAIAEASGGTAIGADATDKASRVRAALVGLRSERRKVNTQRTIPARFQWFLAPALMLLFWDLATAGRRARQAKAAAKVATKAAAALAFFALVLPSSAAAQGAGKVLQEAEKQFKANNPLPAARSFKRAIESGDRRPATLYNFGTALLAADSLDSAIEVLSRAATIPSRDLQANTFYNLGLANLKRGMTMKGEQASSSYKAAARAYRSVLLGNPKDEDARWNYELAKKKEQEASNSPSGGGGGGNNNNQQQQQQNQGLAKNQAAQLLDAAARDERDVRDKHQRAETVKSVRGRDW